MTYPTISMYSHIADVQSNDAIPLDIFLENIQKGEWQDIVIPIRAIKDKKQRDERKKSIAPSVTISGTFSPTRADDKLLQHSGFIAIDVDNLGTGVENFKNLVGQDKYTHAVFTSISGYGVCIIVKIEPDRHRDAYQSLAAYYTQRYKQPVDPTGVNISRARFVSFDPDIIINEDSEVFKKYLPKEKKHKAPPVVFVQSEFDDIVRQMVERQVSCCEDYRDWLKICFALVNRFGEAGRHYFHTLSGISRKYDPSICDAQYDVCLKHENDWSGTHATLSTVYYYAAQAGINIASEKTKKISAATTSLKKSGLSKESIISNLEKFEGIPRTDSEAIVAQAFDSGSDFHDDSDCLIDSLLTWIRSNYNLRRNGVTRRIEDAGVSLEDAHLNTIFLLAKKVFTDLTFDLFSRVVHSNFIPTYNPFTEWYENFKDYQYDDEIMRFWRCIQVPDGEFDRLVYFGTKWLVGLVAGIYGNASPLVLVFTGKKNTGKTRVFRRLLPGAWRYPVDYYAEDKLDRDKDSDILICQKLLVIDDEFDGKSKREHRRYKAMTDKDTITVREPYGRAWVDLKRLCGLGGTCNSLEVITDPDGDRRTIPIEVTGIDYHTMNKIDRNALWAQLFREYHAGYTHELNGNDIQILEGGSEKFTEFTLEYELINSYFKLPDGPALGIQELTASQIKERLEKYSNQRMNLNRIGQELKRIGFVQLMKKINGKTCRVYSIIEKNNTSWNIDLSGFQQFNTGTPL